MLTIYICEDEPLQCARITQYVNDTIMIEDLDVQPGLASGDPHSILEAVKASGETGLYFLDIDLGTDMSGLDLAQELRKYDPRGFIVFITTHSEMSHMVFTYKLEALDFILKDHADEIGKRIHECIVNAYTRYTSALNNVQKTLTLKCNDRKITVDYDEILFFETSPSIHKVVLHAINRQVEFYGKLKDVENMLDDTFYRCHRSFIVNRKNIQEVDVRDRIIHMTNGETCLVSIRMLKGLLK